jgi:DNA-binding NarL/FixJ family response regulator
VQVPFDSMPGVISRSHDPLSGCQQFVPALLQRARHGVETALEYSDLAPSLPGKPSGEVPCCQPLCHAGGLAKWPDDGQVLEDDEKRYQQDRQGQTADAGQHSAVEHGLRATLSSARDVQLASDELIEFTADRVDPPLSLSRDRLRTRRRTVALGEGTNRNEVVVDIGLGGLDDPLSSGSLRGVARDELLHGRRLFAKSRFGRLRRQQELRLPRDDVSTESGLKVDHEPLEMVGDDQYLLGLPGLKLGLVQVRRRGQDHTERGGADQHQGDASDQRPTGQAPCHRRPCGTLTPARLAHNVAHDDDSASEDTSAGAKREGWDPAAMRVVLVEDELLLREGLASLLERSGIQVVGQAGDAVQLLQLIDDTSPDLVVIDIRMPPTHTREGLEAAQQIRERHPDIGILVLSAHVEVEHAMELLATGRGIGYLLKSRITDVTEFVDTLERIAKGGSVVDPALVQELLTVRRRVDPLAVLSEREREVLGLMAEGRSNAGIARRLWVTEGTVEKHVRSILQKLNLPETEQDHRRVLAVVAFLQAQ